MNSLPDIIRSDYKQTNFDNLQDDSYDEPLDQGHQLQHPQHRIKITDNPIPLDNVDKNSPIVELDNHARYQKLKLARDRLLQQKHVLKPTPIVISPVKRESQRRNNNSNNNNNIENNDDKRDRDPTLDSTFEPVSTKIFPSSKQREDRIRLLKKMIHDAEKKSQIREQDESHHVEEKEEEPQINEPRPKIERLRDITLSPPESAFAREPRRFSSGSDHLPKFPSKLQNTITPEDISSSTSSHSEEYSAVEEAENEDVDDDDSILIDDAIANFQNFKLQELNKENNFKFDALKVSRRSGISFEDIDKRLAILEFQIQKIESELKQLKKINSGGGSVNLAPLVPKRSQWRNILIILLVSSCFLAVSFLLSD